MKRTALIDGDLLLYRFGHHGQTVYIWEDGCTSTVVKDEQEVIDEMLEFLHEEILGKVRCKEYKVALSAPDPFRYKVLPTYKHNRKDVVKPVLYPVLKQQLLDCGAIVRQQLEADDVLGILATRQKNCIICSIDKDLEQIPGWHFNWNKDSAPRYIPEKQADLKFYTQCLTGDPTDGFSGCPRVGPKTAQKILKRATESGTSVWQAIVDTYAKAGLDESYALTQARVARICRAEDYDFDKAEPIWWNPS